MAYISAIAIRSTKRDTYLSEQNLYRKGKFCFAFLFSIKWLLTVIVMIVTQNFVPGLRNL